MRAIISVQDGQIRITGRKNGDHETTYFDPTDKRGITKHLHAENIHNVIFTNSAYYPEEFGLPGVDVQGVINQVLKELTDREALKQEYGQVWDTGELQQDFRVQSFQAPYVMVTRKADGVLGTLEFQHHPRFYFNFVEA